MPRFHSLSPLVWWSVSLVVAEEIVYVTDLSIFTVLAPCAASAISENVQAQTNDDCPEAVTDLQSCVCTKNNNFASISTGISSSVSYSCGSTASEDQASAASVFKAYCNQASVTSFPTPEYQYITDFPAWQERAPCAASGLSYITYDLCNAEPSLLATCVCSKNQNSLLASQGINTSVKYSCSSHTADIESAQAVFAGYCSLVEGTTSFPSTSEHPGDITYYITAMSEYSALAPCAQSAVSYGVLSSGMSGFVSSDLSSDEKYYCNSTASEDVSSALEVFDLYCSAVKGMVTPAGIIELVVQTVATGSNGVSGPKETGTTGGSGSSSSSSGSSSSEDSTGSGGSVADLSGKSNIGMIVGVVIGGIAVLAIICFIIFFFWRISQRNQGHDQTAPPPTEPEVTGKTELDATGAGWLVSRVDNVSPISAYSSSNTSELQGQNTHPLQPPFPQMPELYAHNLQGQGQNAYPSHLQDQQTSYATQEAHSHQIYEAAGQRQPQVYEAHGQPRSELQGVSWQSGPVAP
ncbi:hypothetical protein GGR53DRAFT_517776 [Hypoxylon sp. FL1150]|nr:hypothetical protein GGR53DRAFT_517776 [Hypoxylon sp. FL1150]